MQLIIVEDSDYQKLLPITATRPAFGIICGTMSLEERIRRSIPAKLISCIIRDEVAAVLNAGRSGFSPVTTGAGERLYVNGRVIWNSGLSAKVRSIRKRRKNAALYCGDTWAVIYKAESDPLPEELIQSSSAKLSDDYMLSDAEAVIINYPWDIIYSNAEQIEVDFNSRKSKTNKKIAGKVSPQAALIQKKNIIIGKGSSIGPFTVIDASKGPVIIESEVTVNSHTVINGPVWIGSKTVIKAGTQIGEGTSVGYNCRVAGEVMSTVMHGFSNKAHHGFLGHSYICEWVNLGAGTTNSNLKNDYGPVRVMINKSTVDSGKTFFGMVVGDHSRTGINTMINTGSVIGVACNIFGADFPPKNIPDFSWGGAAYLKLHLYDKFLQNAERMMSRRGMALSEPDKALLRKLYESRKE